MHFFALLYILHKHASSHAWAEATLSILCLIWSGGCQKMHNNSRGNAFHMFTIRHTIWSLICTPNIVWLATVIFFLLIPMTEMFKYCFLIMEVSHYHVVMIMVGPRWQIPVHNWGQTFSYFAQQSSQANMWSSARKQRNMGKRTKWGGCDLNPREGESHTEIHTQAKLVFPVLASEEKIMWDCNI